MTESLNAKELHADATVVDGLVISNWSREVFEDLHINQETIDIIFDTINKKKETKTKETVTLKIKQ